MWYTKKKKKTEEETDSIEGKVLVLHVAYSDVIPGTTYSPPNTTSDPGDPSEYKNANSYPSSDSMSA